ncbi:MAG TPA: hypothetical protein ENG87_03140, partial [Candidatus Pacearchaeota archaeon]|nr:hypothetical protein [Candidatus Pacearchaeota archaeon]
MKILQIVPAYAPAWAYGGTARVMFSLAKGLVERGHKVTVYSTDAYDESSRIITDKDMIDGIKIYYFRNISNWLAFKKRFIPISFRSFLKQHIENFDIVHLSGTRNYLSIFTNLYSYKKNIPLAFSAHGSLPRRNEGLKTIYDFFFVKPMIKNAGLLITQTKNEIEIYKDFCAKSEKISLIPLPIHLSEMPVVHRGEFRRRYGF